MEMLRSCLPLENDERPLLSEDTAIGGQAVIEGVMMRAPRSIATAVRKPDSEILVKSDLYTALSKRYRVLNTPILRGAVTFFETLVIGIRALNFSADVAIAEHEKAEGGAHWERTRTKKIRDGLILIGVIVLAFAAGIGIFFALPLFLTEIMGLSKNALSFNVIAGIMAQSTRASTPSNRGKSSGSRICVSIAPITPVVGPVFCSSW